MDRPRIDGHITMDIKIGDKALKFVHNTYDSTYGMHSIKIGPRCAMFLCVNYSIKYKVDELVIVVVFFGSTMQQQWPIVHSNQCVHSIYVYIVYNNTETLSLGSVL